MTVGHIRRWASRLSLPRRVLHLSLPRRVLRLSLRLRLMLAAGLIALAALFGAWLAVSGINAAGALIGAGEAAQTRLEQLSSLSARVGDFAVVSVEGVTVPGPGRQRQDRMAAQVAVVEAAFATLDRALAEDVAAAEGRGDTEQVRRATRSLILARMRANFDALVRAAVAAETSAEMRSALDGFATRFSPLLTELIEEERRIRDAAFAAVEALQARLSGAGFAAATTAAVLFGLFYVALVRPLLRRLDHVAAAAAALGRAGAGMPPATDRHDELGLVLAELGRAAARIGRRRLAVDRDRARLEAIVAERTAELSAANARLAATDADRRRFFSDVGHELRTPLTVILAESGLATSAEAITEAEARAALTVIAARARRLGRRVDDLLRVARSESGQLALDLAPFELGEAAREAIEDAGPLARRRGILIEAELAAGLFVSGDRDWCRQVIAGVLDNAIRHSPQGGRIGVAVRADGDKMRADVTDGGDGVPQADQRRIFERHQRGEGARAGLGFGVGLALAAWIMEQHGGSIRLQSPVPESGVGTRVSLIWPGALDG